jgi:hypothetical protein
MYFPMRWGWAAMRGGAWNNNRRNARCAYRNRNVPDNFNNNIGFRLFSHDNLNRLPANPTFYGGRARRPIECQRSPIPAGADQPNSFRERSLWYNLVGKLERSHFWRLK